MKLVDMVLQVVYTSKDGLPLFKIVEEINNKCDIQTNSKSRTGNK